jgi:O-methyltransferase involved in polyketide biosynthesis
MPATGHERISPTAHYTSYVWFRAGLSHAALTSPLGRALHTALRPFNLGYERFSRHPSLDQMLLARHRVLDHLLERAIAAGTIGQVIEVAAGLSPRGFTFARRHAGLRYLEADLPDMAEQKRRRLDDAGLYGADHHVVDIDALADDGPRSLAALAASRLDASRGTAIITEGLLGYFPKDAVEGMWRRFARVLRGFPAGLYLSDLNLAGDASGMRGARTFRALLSAFARGEVHLHFDTSADVEAALRAAGFARASVRLPTEFAEVDVPGRDRGHAVRLIEAWLEPRSRALSVGPASISTS